MRLGIRTWERHECCRASFLLGAGYAVSELVELIQELWVLRYQVVDVHGQRVLS